jgi:hypothetical protein
MSTINNDDGKNDDDDIECRHHSLIHHSEQPFAKILTLADSNLSQAESILSSLGCGERLLGLPSEDSDSEEAGGGGGGAPVSLGSDIESNIRRLERTQAKINAALETFRWGM